MAEAIASVVLKQLGSVTSQQIEKEIRLVVGVDEEVEKIRSNLEAIQAELHDAEQRQVKEQAVRRWLDDLKDTSYDMEDVLDEWNTALLKLQIEGGHDDQNALARLASVCFSFLSSCFCIKEVLFSRNMAVKIREINKKLDHIAHQRKNFHFNVIQPIEKPKKVPSIALVDESEICGRVDEKNNLITKLLSKSNEEPKSLDIISIVGMGGIGKTTLAQFAYNDNQVINNFNKRIWVCVSNPFDEHRIAKAIIEALDGSASNLGEFNSLIEKIHESIKDKKFLLVLDDVWTESYNHWEPFYSCLKNGLHGSKILVTTRNEEVARMMKSINIIPINKLSEKECWSLFKKTAFFEKSDEEREELEEIGLEIVEKCKGLPLAAKTIGSLLLFKRTRKEWIDILNSEMWKIKEIEEALFSPLLLSYNDLPFMIKRCFLYCAIFPKDHDINKDELIQLWMAQGYHELEQNMEMEITSQKYFNYLVVRSFFQDFKKDDNGNIIFCKMHDIVHDFAQFMSKNECCNVEVFNVEEPFVNPSHKQVLHAMLMLKQWVPFPQSVCSVKKLRSLIWEIDYEFYLVDNSIMLKLFGELTYLRTLDISRLDMSLRFEVANLVEEIPKEIGKLIHLRYFNLSYQKIEKLSDTICELYNLQTLNLTLCYKLKELPQSMGKLLNLRHLINEETYSLSYMPIGIVRLKCLRTLSEFVVSGGGHDGIACCLEHLKDFNHLQGTLSIRGLGYVANMAETKRKQILKDKRNLLRLKLRFDKDEEGERINEDDELLLEALQPPSDLEELRIYFYRGNAFYFGWMMTLTKLKMLDLISCYNCTHLSPLGKLPLLESLYIQDMNSVKRMNDKFWGLGIDDTSSSVILFPKLKFLMFCSMYNWEEWDYGIKRKGEEDDIRFMPCLASLSFYDCEQLKALPEGLLQRTTLTELRIVYSQVLEDRYKKETGGCWYIISHIPNIQIKYQYVQGGHS